MAGPPGVVSAELVRFAISIGVMIRSDDRSGPDLASIRCVQSQTTVRALCEISVQDAVISYLQRTHGLRWCDLRNIPKPIQYGDVLVLPVVSFSADFTCVGVRSLDAKRVTPAHRPAVTMFGGDSSHPLAYTKHNFRSSWRSDAT